MKIHSSSIALVALFFALAAPACGDDPEDDNSNNSIENQNTSSITDLDPATLAEEDDARTWAGYSAPATFISAILGPQLDAIGDDLEEEVDCPATVEDEDSITISGGCIGDDDRAWEGSFTASDSVQEYDFDLPSGSFGIKYSEFIADDFTLTSTESCDSDATIEHEVFTSYNGSVTINAIDENEATFVVDMVIRGNSINGQSCELIDEATFLDYQGSFVISETDAEGSATRHTWNGSGEFGASDIGRVDAETLDEVIDTLACEEEPFSGLSRFTSEGTVLEVRYNGDTDCDEDATVSWYLDDVEQGQITEVRCSTTSTTPAIIGFLLVSIFLFRLRRRTSSLI